MVPYDKSGCIEDLFSRDDYKKYAQNGTSEKSKTIMATEFNQKIENSEITLDDISQETKDNFTNIYQKIGVLITQN